MVLTNGPTITVGDLPMEVVRNSRAGSRFGEELSTTGGAVAVQRAPTAVIRAGHLPDQIEQIERERLLEALDVSRGNKAKAAALLGLPRSTFCSKLKKLGISS